ncbi:MAG: acyl-CoA dehydrogenase [Marinosulfonomonas sp.]
MTYRAPIQEFQFLFDHIVGFDAVTKTDRFSDATPDMVTAILTEAGRLSQEELAPLQRVGDTHGAQLVEGQVRTAPGFDKAYRAIADGGWIGIGADPEHGGMGLPMAVTTAVNDMMSSACLALQLNPLMTQGQIDAVSNHANEELQRMYLPNLISGKWSGTMNLTEPQAGSDVGALKTTATPRDDGTYSISGQKIFISWADNDFTENVCHLVLARLPDAVPGTKGISLFMVPKFVPDAAGQPGDFNNVNILGLEGKMGLHGSPTAVVSYEGARGWLVGQENAGMNAMFTMMNNARLGVGVQGIGQAEAAYQIALDYARDRRQGRSPVPDGTGTILDHADVRRMLATMKADIFAARAIALDCAVAIDIARATGGPDHAARAAVLTPIAKAFGTDTGCAVADMGIQVHGGIGFIEDSGAAQYLRDVRVTAIYEGTNGIQSMDLVGRKLMDNGAAVFALLDDMQQSCEAAKERFPDLHTVVSEAVHGLRQATKTLLTYGDLNNRFAGSVPYLRAFARVLGAHYHLKAAVAELEKGKRLKLAHFYVYRLLPEHAGLLKHATAGAVDLYDFAVEDFAT